MPETSATSWLGDHVMNLLVDYYTEVPFRPYGSGATRENVLPWLQQLDLGYICIYAKGHSGFTSWHSSLGTAHARLAQDMPQFFRAVTREADTRLVLYYSGLLDGIAGDRHPEWCMQNPDGSPKRYFDDFGFFHSTGLCPQSAYWEEWVMVQLRELIGQYDPDGIWVDGDWPGPCHCPACRERVCRDNGWRGSWESVRQREDFGDHYAAAWKRIEGEWRERFNAFVKELKPDCAYSAGNVSPRREFLAPFDWRSGDFFSPGFFNLHDMARMMRWYATLGVPYDAYVCDTSFTHGRKQVRSRTKTVDRMQQEAAIVCANGAAAGYWTYPLGDGALIPSRLTKAAAVRRFLAEREPVFLHTTPAPVTAIVVSDPACPAMGNDAVSGAHKALAALHLSPVIMDETGLAGELAYGLIVLPEQTVVDDASVARLRRYVESGGRLLTTGATLNSQPLRELLGIADIRPGALEDGHVRLNTHDEPTGIDRPWDAVELSDARELYALYKSWDQSNPECEALANNWPMHGALDEEHPDPAGVPAAIVRAPGQGVAVHLATAAFTHYRVFGDPQLLRWLREIVDFLLPDRLQTDAPSWVDVSVRQKGGKRLVHFVNQNPGRDVAKLGTGDNHTNHDVWVDEIPAVGPYACRMRVDARPSSITWEPGGTDLALEFEDGWARFEVPRFHIHGCAVIG